MKRPYIVGIYLAAGSSKRFGSNKLSTLLNNKPLGQYGLEAALHSNLDHVIVVGREKKAMNWLPRNLLTDTWELVWCKDAHLGQAHSIGYGLLQAMKKEADGVMIMLADQPFITTKIINKIIDTYLQSLNNQMISFVAASYQQTTQPPVLFHTNMFNHLLKLTGDSGAKSLIRTNKQKGIILAFDKKESFMDIDTEEDWRQIDVLHKENL